jgi:hypothetical protein
MAPPWTAAASRSASCSWCARSSGAAGAGSDEESVLSLDEALEWRRQLVLRDLEPPLSSVDAGLLIYDGKARGGGAAPHEGHRALPTGAAGASSECSEDEDEDFDDGDGDVGPLDEPPESAPLAFAEHLARLAYHHRWPPARAVAEVHRQLAPLCDAPQLAEWFAHLGAETRVVLSDLRAFTLAEALVKRDELEGAASASLQGQLHHLGWMPLLELPGRHAVLFWKRRGVSLHLFRDGAWQAAPWSRCTTFDDFVAALSRWVEPPLLQHESPNELLDLGLSTGRAGARPRATKSRDQATSSASPVSGASRPSSAQPSPAPAGAGADSIHTS